MTSRTCRECGVTKDKDKDFSTLRATSGKQYKSRVCKACKYKKDARFKASPPDIDRTLYNLYSEIMDRIFLRGRKRPPD